MAIQQLVKRDVNDPLFEIEIDDQRYPLERVYSPHNHQLEHNFSLVAVAMVKNEADIIQAWLAHIYSLFDRIYILDHNSIDGTYSYLLKEARSQAKLQIFTFAHQGMFQAEIINCLIKIAALENPEAWIFPLDADEFIRIKSKKCFLTRLGKIPKDKVLSMKWINTLPVSLRGDDFFSFSVPCLIPPYPGDYAKLAVHASTFQKENWRFAQGNHQLVDSGGSAVGEDKQVEFAELLHLPIRSFAQFVLKCIQGYLAYQALPVQRRDGSQSYHRRAMINKVNQMGSFDPGMIRRFIAEYGLPSYKAKNKATIKGLLRRGWRGEFLEVSHLSVGAGVNRQYRFIQLAEEALKGKEYPNLKEFLRLFQEWQSKAKQVYGRSK